MLGLRGRRHGRIHTQELIHDSAVSLVQEHHTMQELCGQSGGGRASSLQCRHLFREVEGGKALVFGHHEILTGVTWPYISRRANYASGRVRAGGRDVHTAVREAWPPRSPP